MCNKGITCRTREKTQKQPCQDKGTNNIRRMADSASSRRMMNNKQLGGHGVNDNLRGPDFQHFGCFVDPRHVLKHSFRSGLNKI